MTKLAFFDVDGTLSAPFYLGDRGGMVLGRPSEAWHAYCIEHGADTYEYCKVVLPTKAYAEKLASRGTRLFVLSTTQSDEETLAKEAFVQKNFPGLFEKVLVTWSDEEKIETIRQIAAQEGVKLGECELVEDTYRTLLAAHLAGIKATHISYLLTGEEYNS